MSVTFVEDETVDDFRNGGMITVGFCDVVTFLFHGFYRIGYSYAKSCLFDHGEVIVVIADRNGISDIYT